VKNRPRRPSSRGTSDVEGHAPGVGPREGGSPDCGWNVGATAVIALIAGSMFGAGLVIGGMTRPSKVRGFLDFTGSWDPTLMFVMGGAVAVHFIAYRLIRGRAHPVLAERFQLPTRKDLDVRLIVGAALFGVGWGLGGFCPGPAITSTLSGNASVFVFLAAMLGSSFLTGRLDAPKHATHATAPSARSKAS
jgi:uncharacterized membrane protein YedE/YeeE